MRALIVMVMVLLGVIRPARADVRAIAEELAGAGGGKMDRAVGMVDDGAEFAGRVQAAVGANGQVFRQPFVMTVPVVEVCRATVGGGGGEAIALYPLEPMGGQGASVGTPGHPLEAAVIYGGDGHWADFRGEEIAGRFVALNMDSAIGGTEGGWERCAALGAAGVIFLGDGRTTATAFLEKYTSVPLGIPRFYCDDAATVARFRAARGGGGSGEALRKISIEARVTWRERRVENVICLIPGRLAPGAAAAPWIEQWMIVQARRDGTSAVMGRAPGATQALNAAALLDVARATAGSAQHCGLVCVWTAGDEWNNRGTRSFFDLVQRGLRDPGRAVANLRQSAADADHGRLKSIAIRDAVERLARERWSGALVSGMGDAARWAVEEELLRGASGIEAQLQQARMSAGGGGADNSGDALKQRRAQIGAATRVLTGRNGSGGGGASAAAIEELQAAARAVLPRWQRDVERRTVEAEARGQWPAIRAAFGTHDPLLFLGLSLTAFAGDRAGGGEVGQSAIGLTARSAYSSGLDVTSRMSIFTRSFDDYARTIPAGSGTRYVSDTLKSDFTLESFFPTPRGFASDAAIGRGQPAAAIATLYERGRFLDTPNDRLEAIDWGRAVDQAAAVERLLLGGGGQPGALTDSRPAKRTNIDVSVADQEVTLFDRAVGETLPRLRAAETLIGGESEIYNHPLGEPLAGTRRLDWYLTHADGTVVFASASHVLESEVRMQAFHFDEAGRPTHALISKQSEMVGLASSFSANADRPVRSMLFECDRISATGLFDPRYLDYLEAITVLDARRTDAAEFSTVYAHRGLAAIFLPPVGKAQRGSEKIQWQILASRGNISNRMILTHADANVPLGNGFGTTDAVAIGPLPWRTAQDFFALNSRRKADLEKFGITNEVIRELQSDSERQRALAAAAEKARDYPVFMGAANALWSLQSQEYQNLIETSNGIIKGVIFLLLGVIPFSYFLERLLIGTPHVYRQIAWFAGIFAVMTAGLWFHPAFRISTTPLMILLAFLILILSSTVVYILWGKFEEEIARLRTLTTGGGGAAPQAHVASFKRGAVLGAAVRLGLSNMRRRGMRTALTLVTLVLLTFTLLCFTSVRESVQVTPVAVRWGGAAANAWPEENPAGILLRQHGPRQLGSDALPLDTVELARELSLPPEVVLARAELPAAGATAGTVARRWWYASEGEQPWRIGIRSRAASHEVAALVGLDRAEAEFQGVAGGIDAVLPHFAEELPENGLPRCWLPVEAREKFAPNETVEIAGYSLSVAGFYDAAAFAKLRNLSGEPLAPVNPAGNRLSAGASGSANPAQAETSYRFLEPVSVAIVPGWMTEQLGARLTSLMFRPAGVSIHPGGPAAAQLEEVAVALAKRSAFTIFVSDGRAIQSINATEAARPQDLGTVLVPMLIAGVIVLNTMLGAVSERTREIHVYTSVGLSPAHVGMLFLAEAGALGTLGVVFGYIFGQGLATVLSWTHLLPGVDLNYSSMSAIITMGLVLGLVMLSALWPARSASRLATPSLQRNWKLPRPVGDVLAVDLPFTVNETAAKGVCAFLAEYLVTTALTGTGRFTADAISGRVESTTQGPVRALAARIWLAPYDLGVIQAMALSIHPTDQPGVFDVHVQLTREAGNPGTWRRLNRPFLVEIRRQFLLWRAVDPARVAMYVEKSASLFGGSAMPPAAEAPPAS